MSRNIMLLILVTGFVLGNVWLSMVRTSDSKQVDIRITEGADVPKLLSTTEVKEAGNFSEEGIVVAVIDGDTIDVDIAGVVQRVRYIGIDTPEKYSDTGEECFAEEATEKNQALVQGQIVRLERDVSEVDRYGRLLRYVYVGEDLINRRLVSEGYAYAVTYPPDVARTGELVKAETAARNDKNGLWSKCN